MDMIYMTMAVLVISPWLAALPALIFFGLYGWTRRRTALFAGILWMAYGLYEAGMYLRLLCSGECNIRIDLLVIYPLLAAITLVALALVLLRGRRPTATGWPR